MTRLLSSAAPFALAGALVLPLGLAVTGTAGAADGATLYEESCAACHNGAMAASAAEMSGYTEAEFLEAMAGHMDVGFAGSEDDLKAIHAFLAEQG